MPNKTRREKAVAQAAKNMARFAKMAMKTPKYAPPEWKDLSKEEKAKRHREKAKAEDEKIRKAKQSKKRVTEGKGTKDDEYYAGKGPSSYAARWKDTPYRGTIADHDIKAAKHSRKVRKGKYKSNPPHRKAWQGEKGEMTEYERPQLVRLKDFERNQPGLTAAKAVRSAIRKGLISPEMTHEKAVERVMRMKGVMNYKGRNTAGRKVSKQSLGGDADYTHPFRDEVEKQLGGARKAKAVAARKALAKKGKDTTPQKGRAPKE